MKKFIIAFLVLLLSIIIGGVTYILTFDVNSYKGQIERVLFDKTGYPVNIVGQMRLSKSLTPTLVVEDIHIKNPTGFDDPALMVAKRAELSFDLVAFFKDVIKIQKVELFDVSLFLEINKLGRENWNSPYARSGSASAAPARPVLSKAAAPQPAQVDSITIKKIEVSYVNRQTETTKNFLLPVVTIKHLVNIDGELSYDKETFTFSGSVKNLMSVITIKRNLNFSFDIQGLASKAKVSGVCRDIMHCEDDVTLNLNLKGNNLKRVFAFFVDENKHIPAVAFSWETAGRLLKRQLLLDGTFDLTDSGVNLSYNIEQDFNTKQGKGRLNLDVIKPELIQGYGLNPVSIQSNYELTLGERVAFTNITAMFDETDVDGNVQIILNRTRPLVMGDLHSHYLKLSNVFYTYPAFKASSGMDLLMNLSIENFSAGNVFARYPVVFLGLKLENNIFEAVLKEGSSIAGGRVVGKMTMNATNPEAPIWDLGMVGEDLKLNQINALKKQVRAGNLDVNLFLNGTGKEAKEIASSLNGEALLLTNQVEIISPIVGELFSEKSADGGRYKSTQDLFVKCGVLNAVVENGVITIDKKAALETSRFNMLMDGTINLKDEMIDMRFIPQPSKGKSGEEMRVISAVSLKGSLWAPTPAVEADITPLLSSVLPGLVTDTDTNTKTSDKKALLAQYTKKPTVTEDISLCRIASSGTSFKTINNYLGRRIEAPTNTQSATVPTEEPEQSQAQKIGREFLNSLSDVLTENAPTKSSSSF